MKSAIVLVKLSILLFPVCLFAQDGNNTAFNFTWDSSQAGLAYPDSVVHIKNITAGMDLDQDGAKEFILPVVHLEDGLNRRSLLVFENNGDDVYDLVWSFQFSGVATELVTADVSDLDGDNNLEILALHIDDTGANAPVLFIFEHTGIDNDYGTSPAATWDLDTPGLDKVRVAKAADLDNDGTQEVVLTSFRTQPGIVIASVSDFTAPVWTTEFVDSTTGGVNVDFAALAFGNMDNDSFLEAVMVEGSSNQLIIIEATGANTYNANYVAMPQGGTNVSVHSTKMADVNADGRDETYIASLGGAVWVVSTSGSATAISTSDIHLIEDTGEQLLEADLGDPDHGPGSDGMDFVIATSNSSTIIDYEYTGGGGGDVTDPANYTRYTAIEQSDIETIVPGGVRTYGLEIADDLDQDGRGEIIFTRGSTRGGETSPSIFIAEFSPVSANVICPPPIFQNCTTSVNIEIDISASAEVLGSFTATLTWDPALLAFVSHSGVLAGFTGNVNTNNIALGTILFNGASATGVPGVFDILIVDFDVIGAVDSTGSVSASFSAMSAALTFANLIPALDVNNCSYSIAPGGLLGDVNGDGFVNSTDALIILSFDVNFPIPQPFLDLINAGFGDVNSDGFTNSTDALIVLSFDVGLPVPFPVGQQFCP